MTEYSLHGITAMGLGEDRIAKTREDIHEAIDELIDFGCTTILINKGSPGAP